MNSWNQPQNNNNNMVMGQAQFNPYSSWNFPNAQPRTFNQPLPTYHAEPIHGENAAWQFPMGPNSDIWLPDADTDIIWWIRTDHVGNKSVNGFNVTARVEQSEVSMNDILKRLTALEDRINVKSNKSNAKRNGDAAVVPATTAEQVN